MSGDGGHGVSVEVDSTLFHLVPTCAPRQALDVLFGCLPSDMETTPVKNALRELDTVLRKRELDALQAWGLSLNYVVISPSTRSTHPDPRTWRR